MRHPQIVVFENDNLLARQLQETATARAWPLRESRQAPACLKLLRGGGPSVLVLRLGRDLRRELSFLDDAHAQLPDVPIIVVGNTENPALASLAYELGAAFVLFPPSPRLQLGELTERLLQTTIERSCRPAAPSGLTPELLREFPHELGS
jgi:DNA-binding NtrC family response regulator